MGNPSARASLAHGNPNNEVRARAGCVIADGMTGERHAEQEPALVFVCRFVPTRNECVRTIRLIEAQDADHALDKFAVQLAMPETPGWIDVLDQNGALIRTRFHAG
jgi:hypothetical protein